nr:hypothetical protein [Tanacetum cinerariifolium]
MGYEHLSITPKTESDEVIEYNAKNLLPIPSECEVTSEDERKCDVPISKNSPVCDNHSETFSDSKIDDDISVYDDDFEDIEYVEALFLDPEIVSVEEENDVVLHEKLLSITRLLSNIESLNDNPTPDCVLNSFESDNSLSDNFLAEFETFCDHTEEMRSGNTTHADNSFPEYDSFCFEIEPDHERLINVGKNDDSSNDPLLEEADLFFAFDNSIPPGILSYESSDSNFEDNPSIPRPPPEPPDAETDAEEIPVVMNDKDKFDEDYYFFMFAKVFSLLFAESEDTIFDPAENPAGSKSRPPMLNKENYVPWSSPLLRYAKSRPNGKLIHNSILNGPYVRKMIPEPGDANRKITVTETFHLQTDDELSDKKLKQIEADDQAIQTILLGLPKDIYAAVDSCETAQEIWL